MTQIKSKPQNPKKDVKEEIHNPQYRDVNILTGQIDQPKSKPDHKASTYIEQHYLEPRSAPKNKIIPPKLPPNYKTKNKIEPPQNILTDKPIQEIEQHPLEPQYIPKNKIQPPKLPPNYKTKNKIEPPKNRPVSRPKSKISQPTFELHYTPKNKITPPKLQPNYTPKNKIKQPTLKQKPEVKLDKKEIIKERIVIDKVVFKDICNEIIEKNPKIKSYTQIGKILEIGSNISKVLKGDLALSHDRFNGLKKLINRDIPHSIKIGNYEKIKLEKNDDTAEFVGIVLGDGNINFSKANYRLDISLNQDEKSYADYVKNFMKSLFNLEPRIYSAQNHKGINIQYTRASIVKSAIDLGLKPGNKVENQVAIPDWIKNNYSKKVRCIKGLTDTDGCFYVSKQDKSIRFTFLNGSCPLVRDFKILCNSLGIKTGNVCGPYKIKDSRTGTTSILYSVSIDAKDQVRSFIDLVKPEKWKIKYNEVGTTLKQLYPSTKNVHEAIEEAFRYKRHFYSVEYAKNLKQLLIEKGSYRKLSNISNNNLPPRRSITKFIKNLFEEKEYRKNYGQNGYNIWQKFNSNLLIDEKQNKIKRFPLFIKQELSKIIKKTLNNTSLSDKEILKKLKTTIDNQNLNGKSDILHPNVLRYERLKYLWDNDKYKNIIENYLSNLIRFNRRIEQISLNKDEINLSALHREFNILGEQKLIKDLIDFIKEREE